MSSKQMSKIEKITAAYEDCLSGVNYMVELWEQADLAKEAKDWDLYKRKFWQKRRHPEALAKFIAWRKANEPKWIEVNK